KVTHADDGHGNSGKGWETGPNGRNRVLSGGLAVDANRAVSGHGMRLLSTGAGDGALDRQLWLNGGNPRRGHR
ncbi:hypothetical protein, partial [Rhodanobacter lindaniclasticus]